MKRSTQITITESPGGEFQVRLHSPDRYLFRDLIEELKSRVPPYERNYDPDIKAWTVCSREPLDEWLDYARGFDAVRIVWEGEPARHSPPPRPGRMVPSDAFTALHLLPTAPPEVVKAVHKTLAQIHHPDRGGDLKTMQTINAAYDVLVKGAAI